MPVKSCRDTTVHPHGKGDESCNTSLATSYQGCRTDLQGEDGILSRPELERRIINIIKGEGRRGALASDVAEWAGCSREWARQLLNRLVDQGRLQKQTWRGAQIHVFMYPKEERP